MNCVTPKYELNITEDSRPNILCRTKKKKAKGMGQLP